MAAIFQGLEASAMRLGLNTPISRALFAASLSSALLWIVKPNVAFSSDGQPRDFVAWQGGASDLLTGVEPTRTPWWLIAGSAGAVFGLFV